ncbi:DNA adenine methylase [Microbacterium sp. 77mftsu3.1]|uniref:DNA adenine methylase n=1 Tax=Microbacterium sp. 77mftsu3.1 TaxID=1761802 RepID=UPI00035E35C0|nr:DNA adenine methylase [Microbacterium sp. 77mftsu3.1]SDH53930.1 DNA adenine methylase [Microbacterium sp. 77mftsu3.1]
MSTRRYLSPLRYPGGKASMATWLAGTFAAQSGLMDVEVWIEPFAGGGGAALALLEQNVVEEAWLIDQNPGIAALWHAITADNESFASRIEQTIPTADLFERSREMLTAPEGVDPFELGYAAFIVNRLSRSGIVAPRAGMMPDPTARFNAAALADRVRHIGTFGSRLRTIHGDGISYLEDLADSGVDDEVLAFVDPPYLREGNRLYSQGMDQAGHQRLADALNATTARWVLTYDDEPAVLDLYPERRVLSYAIRNTANRARTAREYAVLSDNLHTPETAALTTSGAAEWVRAA